MRNRGWELSVNWQDQLKCGFSYGIGFNVFNYKAVVTKYNNPEGLIYNNHTGLATNKGYYEGMDVIIRLLSITETEYYYLKALNLVDSDAYDETINEPIKYPSNVHGGIGMIGISTETSKIIHIEKPQR